MPSLIEYPAWLNRVNAVLNILTGGLFTTEDFDYPWIEKYQAGLTAGDAAKEALEGDGFIVERLAAAVARLRPSGAAPCPA